MKRKRLRIKLTRPTPTPDEPLILNNIKVYIDWTKWNVGASVFIPAYHQGYVEADLIRALANKPFHWICKKVCEGGIMGVRVWRVQ